MSIASLAPFTLDSFDPTHADVGLRHWWSGRYPSLITPAGGLVSSLRDVKAAAELTQPLSGARPGNSDDRIILDGFDDTLSAESTFDLVTGDLAVGMEIWIRVRQNALPADTTNRRIFAYGRPATGFSVQIYRVVSGGVNRVQASVCSGNGVIITQNTVDFTGDHTIRLRMEQTRALLEVNGISTGFQNYAGAVNVGATRMRIGASTDNTAANFGQCDVKDIPCTALLSDSTAAKMRAFLST